MRFPLALFLLSFLIPSCIWGQQLNAEEILGKSVKFHDPEGIWNSVHLRLDLTGEYANGQVVQSEAEIYMPSHDFVLSQIRDERKITRKFVGDTCLHFINDSGEVRPEEKMRYKLTCKQTARMRNYYAYLYGLPMKLQDASAMLDPKVEQEVLKGKNYLVLTVRYAPEVGIDIWRFYIDPKTYEMKAYQFYKNERDKKGEMIFLEGLTQVGSMKLPKERTWYDWPEKKLLGKDIVERGVVKK